MWVVKIGGSLNGDPLLPDWLELLAQLGGGRVTVVCGGGSFADEVRRSQAHWQFDDLPAHNMAVLAMAQSAYLAHGLQPALRPAVSKADILRVLHAGRTALWLPLPLLRDEPTENTNWDVAGDSIALGLAAELNAERLVLVKSCPVPEGADFNRLVAHEVLDRRFATLARQAAFPIDLVNRTELARVRALLLGTTRSAA